MVWSEASSSPRRTVIPPPPAVVEVAGILTNTVLLLQKAALIRRAQGNDAADKVWASARATFLTIDIDACRAHWYSPWPMVSSRPARAAVAAAAGGVTGAIARKVYDRDRWRCQYCGVRVLAASAAHRLRFALADCVPHGDADADRHVGIIVVRASPDHVVPASRGGPHDKENLVTACWPCQFKRGNIELADLGLVDPRVDPLLVSDGWGGLAGATIPVAPPVPGLQLHWEDTALGPKPNIKL